MLWLPQAVGSDILTVCSTPSRRVAALRPRYAGLAALTASPRTYTNPALNRRPLESTPKMLWSAKCSESFILKRLLTTCGTKLDTTVSKRQQCSALSGHEGPV